MDRSPRLYTIPPSAPFLPTLLHALLSGKLVPDFTGEDPARLAEATIYLPTLRACRLAREAFLDALNAEAAVLPRIVPLGDIDEDEIIFAQAATGAAARDALELPPALGTFERRALLVQLILAWTRQLERAGATDPPLIVNSPGAAFGLADDLARLIDDMTTRQVPWDRLDQLVPDAMDAYWQLTLRFLKIAREQWPKLLAVRGAVDPAQRRDRLIAAERARLEAAPDRVVIAAGSTGSMPSTAALLATIAHLPRGAVVLPGLDTMLDADAWSLIGGTPDVAPAAGHPQFAMHALLARLGLRRDEVVALAPPYGREALISEVMRPAAATHQWRDKLKRAFLDHAASSFAGVAVVEAGSAEEEALAIAVALRETLETPHATAALVTPDRGLARRVAAALGRWTIVADESSGAALSETSAGRFAQLAAEAVLSGLEPVSLLSLLKHPLLRLGARQGACLYAANALERAILRGPRPRAGIAGLEHALRALRSEVDALRSGRPSLLHRSDPRAALSAGELDAAADLISRLGPVLRPFAQVARVASFRDLAGRHRALIETLSEDESGDVLAYAGEDGAALADVFDDIMMQTDADIPVAPGDYVELFVAALQTRVVRRPPQPGARVNILGPLEARLTRFDRVVLGGLVEGVWPPDVRTDPWLSRPMRHALGLDLPERRIGLSAHDFAQLFGSGAVVLTRAAKLGGTPTVASRFLQRLAAIAGEDLWAAALARGANYIAWAHDLDRARDVRPVKRPEPKPPRAARPTSLSVTEIEHWLRDPYSIYARHMLGLRPLDPVDTPPGARDRGIVIHGAIGEFTERYCEQLPDDIVGELLVLGGKHFKVLEDFPEAHAFWWPRFVRIAHWFAEFEKGRRPLVTKLGAELRGKLTIPLGERAFTLTARADRIEHLGDGRYAILDYKTGSVRTPPQVRSGLAPQLTLEGAILHAGGFENTPKGSIAELMYVSLRGGQPAGELKPIAWDDSNPDLESDNALRRLTEVVQAFDDEDTPYRSRERPMFMRRGGGDYDHLARIKEWSLSGGADDLDGQAE
ncbi:MAG: double-strand break repair protein AddB [Xanthobacteraceae bacterium]|nr:double-strand break repair protein AddB [Xanthobacteraceae bacterium]